MQHCSTALNIDNQHIWLPINKGKAKVPVKNIIRLEAHSNYTKFYIKDYQGLIIVSKTLKHYQKKLNTPTFIRPHQSHLVNTAYVANYSIKNGSYLILKDTTQIEISRRKKRMILGSLSIKNRSLQKVEII